jgi:DNA-binding Lrp family transcriptional regulator
MKKTTLATVDGFTPLIDALVQQFGIVTAAVFGKVWRYCQMSDGVCKASQERLARELGINRVTVNQHIDILVKAGYLKDKTPNLSGKPHEYADTGKANLSVSITGKAEPVKQIDTTCKSNLQPPVNIIDTKKEVKKEKDKIDVTIDNRERVGEILKKHENKLVPNSNEIIDAWLEYHTLERIEQAAAKYTGKNVNYLDTVLIDWQVNGYPPTRQERIEGAKKQPETTGPVINRLED